MQPLALLMLSMSVILASQSPRQTEVVVTVSREQIQELNSANDQFLGYGVYNVPQARSNSIPIGRKRSAGYVQYSPDPLGTHLGQVYRSAEISKSPTEGYIRLTM